MVLHRLHLPAYGVTFPSRDYPAKLLSSADLSHNGCPHSKAVRSLILSLSEIEIRLGHHDNVEHLINELLNIYNMLL